MGLGEHKDILPLQEPVTALLSDQDKFVALLVVIRLLQQHGRRQPKAANLDASVPLVLRCMLQLEEFGTTLDVVAIGVRERDNIEVVSARRLQLASKARLQVDFWCFIVLALRPVAGVE